MFRRFFIRKKVQKRVEKLRVLAYGSRRGPALSTYYSFFPKTPMSKEDDSHQCGFIEGYLLREHELKDVIDERDSLKVLLQDCRGRDINA